MRSCRRRRRYYPDDHPSCSVSTRPGDPVGRAGDHQRAVEELESIVEGGVRSVGESHPVVVDATRQLGDAYLALGKEDEAFAYYRAAVTQLALGIPPVSPARQSAVAAFGRCTSGLDGGTPEAIEIYHEEYLACLKYFLGHEHELSYSYLDRVLGSVEHDRTGGLAFAAAERAMQTGATPPPTIRALLQLSLASELGLHPSFFAHPTPPLPDAYDRLLVVESMDGSIEKRGELKIKMAPQVLAPGSEWRFLVLGEGETPPSGWEDTAFDDDAWRSGVAPLGFGEPGLATDLGLDVAPEARSSLLVSGTV